MAALANAQKRLSDREAVPSKTRVTSAGLDRATIFFWPTGDGGETTTVVMPVDMMGGVSA
jgi:hypothetical protein